MPLDRVLDRFHKGKESAIRGAKQSIAWVMTQQDKIRRLRNGDRAIQDARVINRKLTEGIELQEWEWARCDELYELAMKANGLPSVPKHIDRKPRGLRFG